MGDVYPAGFTPAPGDVAACTDLRAPSIPSPPTKASPPGSLNQLPGPSSLFPNRLVGHASSSMCASEGAAMAGPSQGHRSSARAGSVTSMRNGGAGSAAAAAAATRQQQPMLLHAHALLHGAPKGSPIMITSKSRSSPALVNTSSGGRAAVAAAAGAAIASSSSAQHHHLGSSRPVTAANGLDHSPTLPPHQQGVLRAGEATTKGPPQHPLASQHLQLGALSQHAPQAAPVPQRTALLLSRGSSAGSAASLGSTGSADAPREGGSRWWEAAAARVSVGSGAGGTSAGRTGAGAARRPPSPSQQPLRPSALLRAASGSKAERAADGVNAGTGSGKASDSSMLRIPSKAATGGTSGSAPPPASLLHSAAASDPAFLALSTCPQPEVPVDEKGRPYPYVQPPAFPGTYPTVASCGAAPSKQEAGLQPLLRLRVLVRFCGIVNSPVKFAFREAGIRPTKGKQWNIAWGNSFTPEEFAKVCVTGTCGWFSPKGY